VLGRIPLRHRGVDLCSEPSNFEHRAIIRKAHHVEIGSRLEVVAPVRHRMIAASPLDPFPGSQIMFNHSATDANKSLEPPLPYPGATPDAERAKKPPLPEPLYEPYAKKPPLPGPPYAPYAKKPALPRPPYEPYKGM